MTIELTEIDAGLFGMYDYFVPGLQAGSYTFRLESAMASPETKESFHGEVATAEFTIDSPRFSLSAKDEVRACSPQAGGNADYQRILPHIVLDKRALPWERQFGPATRTGGQPQLPWMALIVLSQNEMATDGAQILDILGRDLVSNGGPILEINAQEAESSMTVIELSARLLRAICPRIDELPLLAHVRRISTTDRSAGLAGQSHDVAIVISNRLAQPGENVALLVSLEGWDHFLEDPNIPNDELRLRLVVLHSWRFINAAGDNSFSAVVRGLNVDMFGSPASLMIDDESALQNMLRRGHTAIAYQALEGDKTFAWYRGPFLPITEDAFVSDSLPFDSSDAALFFDEDTGMLNVSLSAAFQLGRLLAFSAPSFGAALRDWNQKKQLDLLARNESTANQPFIAEMEQYLASHANGNSASDSTMESIKAVGEWLVQLRQLQFVPFRYLVPSGHYLPPESMRLFHVDENWVDALTDGSLSIGATTSSSQLYLRSSRGAIRETLRRLLAFQRGQMRRNTSDEHAPLCGFLLRSKLLQTYPDLDIECFSSANSQKLDIVRRDMLTRELLLVLVLGKPAEIRLKLPRESLTYSYDSSGLRPRISRAKHGAVGTRNSQVNPIPIADYFRRNSLAPEVLDVRRLHSVLEGPADTSGARFALHWLNGPDDVAIRWEPATTEGTS